MTAGSRNLTAAEMAKGLFVYIGPALIALLILFPVIFFVPLLTTKLWFYTRNEITFASGAHDLFETDKVLFFIVFAFGVAFPLGKIILSIRYWYYVEISAAQRGAELLGQISKLSMLDVMLLALLVIAFKGVGVGTIEIRYGLYVYAGFILVSLFLNLAISSAIRAIGDSLSQHQLPAFPQLTNSGATTMIKTIVLLGALLVLVLVYFNSQNGSAIIDSITATEVNQLLKQPMKYDGKLVTVQGTVVDSAAVLGIGGYRLRQADSEIYVVSGHGIPQPGSKVVVTGTFKQALAVGAFQYAVILEK